MSTVIKYIQNDLGYTETKNNIKYSILTISEINAEQGPKPPSPPLVAPTNKFHPNFKVSHRCSRR